MCVERCGSLRSLLNNDLNDLSCGNQDSADYCEHKHPSFLSILGSSSLVALFVSVHQRLHRDAGRADSRCNFRHNKPFGRRSRGCD